jgi:hypothetical protein
VALFSDNNPAVSWVQRLALRHSNVAAQLVRALALRVKLGSACPITPCHIPGVENSMTDIPSQSFRSVKEWHCKTEDELLTMFNTRFPLPNQGSWTVFWITSRVCTRVTSVLQMRDTGLGEWRRLPRLGRHIGNIGVLMSHLWEWSLIYRQLGTSHEFKSSQGLPLESDGAAKAGGSRSRLQRSLALLQPLARRSPWPAK